MGRIIRNGIEYGSGGTASNVVYLTQEAYDALSDDKLTDGVEYRITDANTDSTKARNIAYDNAASGLEATSVQGAIDVMNESLPVMDCGIINLTTINASSGNDFNITFNVAFNKTPIVVATFISENNSGEPILRIKNITTSGATIRVYNATAAESITSGKVSWIAMSK